MTFPNQNSTTEAMDWSSSNMASPPSSRRSSSATGTRRRMDQEVRFSESSMLYVYPDDPDYRSGNKAYTSSDRKTSMRNALRDAIHIKTQLGTSSRSSKEVMVPGQDDDTTASSSTLEEQLKACGIPHEEILGLEHLIFEEPRRTIERRRGHNQVILMEQRNQQMATGTVDDNRLARMSILLTRRVASQARSRASCARAA